MRPVVTTSFALLLLFAHSGCAQLWTSSDYSDSVWSDSENQSARYSDESSNDVWAEDETSVASSTAGSSFPSEVSTTGIGAIAGAAIGAGLGLAIGSTSGNAGEGFALGTAAGAAVGAGVGSNIQAKDELVKEQEVVAKQQAIIGEQERQLKELRRNLGDDGYQIPDYNTPSVSGVPNSAAEVDTGVASRTRSRARFGTPVAPSELERSYDANATESVKPASRSAIVESDIRMIDPQPTSVARVQESDLVVAPPAQATSRSDAFAATSGAEPMLPPANVDTSDFEVKRKSNKVVSSGSRASGLPSAQARRNQVAALDAPDSVKPSSRVNTAAVAPSVKSMPAIAVRPAKPAQKVARRAAPVKEVRKVTTTVTERSVEKSFEKQAPVKVSEKTVVKKPVQLAKQTLSQGCGDADREAKRGHEATSDADRLFYFRRAIRLCPEKASYFVEVGKVYVNIGRTEDAQHEFNKALELDPENDEAQEQLSVIMMGATY